MSTDVTHGQPLIDWGVAMLPVAGQLESGDRHLVRPSPKGVLVAVVDGLGHGPAAAVAAQMAISVLERLADEALVALVRRCHQELLNTRGVVMSLASFNALDGMLTWLGVGNVEGTLWRADACARPVTQSLLLQGGVVGYQLPPLHASIFSVMPGDTLILATDGIRTGFAQELNRSDPPQPIADRILAGYGKRTDDALVLVARYLGHVR